MCITALKTMLKEDTQAGAREHVGVSVCFSRIYLLSRLFLTSWESDYMPSVKPKISQ